MGTALVRNSTNRCDSGESPTEESPIIAKQYDPMALHPTPLVTIREQEVECSNHFTPTTYFPDITNGYGRSGGSRGAPLRLAGTGWGQDIWVKLLTGAKGWNAQADC